MKDADTSAPVSTAHPPRLTLNQFTGANVTLTEGQIVLNVGLTSEAAGQWRAFTAKSVGQVIAFGSMARLFRLQHATVLRTKSLSQNLRIRTFFVTAWGPTARLRGAV